MRILCGYAAIVVLSSVGQAAAPSHACEADPATFQTLSKWELTYNDARLGFADRIAPLWKAIEEQPGNVFLHHAYQRIFLNYIESLRFGVMDGGYQKLIAAHRDDLALKYAYARALYGNRTADSKQMLEEVIAADPDFPWAHLALARVYQNASTKSEDGRAHEVERFFELCPGSMAPEAYEFTRDMPLEFRVKAGAALRKRIDDTATPNALAVLQVLWEFEFQGATGDSERAEVRKRIRADLTRLRKAAGDNLTLLQAANHGYQMVEDREGSRWAREQIAVAAPHSFMACRNVIERWYQDRPRVTLEDSREKVQGYYRELLAETDKWIEICPLDESPWRSRFTAMRELPDQPAEQVLATGTGLLRASEANESNWFVAPSLMVADWYERRGIGFDQVINLLERNRRDSEARLESDRHLEWFPKAWKAQNEADAKESYVETRVMAIRKYVHDGQREKAALELAGAEQGVASADQTDEQLWLLRPHLIDGYIAMGDTAKAAGELRKLKQWLDASVPAETSGRGPRLTYQRREATYWQREADVAELEKRPKDALAADQKVLQTKSGWEVLAYRFEMIDKTEALWKQTGGSPEEWRTWLSHLTATIAQPAQNWNPLERALPEFTLTDMAGRKWTLDDLKGKVTLVNMWATWCGPCIAELPYVQKVAAAVKDRKDVQVLSLNVDENPGLIEPFLKLHGIGSLTVIPAADFVMQSLKINGFPETWIVDRDGVVRRGQGGFTGEPSKWVETVLATLK